MQPGSGRFLTADRGVATASSPGSWNRYTYTGGDPVNRVDATGNQWVCVGPEDDPSCFDDDDGNSIAGSNITEMCNTFWSYGSSLMDPQTAAFFMTMCPNYVVTPLPPGGGGGGGAPTSLQGNTAPTQINNPQHFQPGIISTLAALLSGTGCGYWFEANYEGSGIGQKGQSMNDFLKQTLPSFVGTGDFVGGTSNAAQGGLPDGYLILLNNQGAFFGKVPAEQTLAASDKYKSVFSAINGGSQEAQGFIMLHEIAHLFGMFFDDANNRANEAYNNDLLWSNCGSLIQTLSNKSPQGGPQRPLR